MFVFCADIPQAKNFHPDPSIAAVTLTSLLCPRFFLLSSLRFLLPLSLPWVVHSVALEIRTRGEQGSGYYCYMFAMSFLDAREIYGHLASAERLCSRQQRQNVTSERYEEIAQLQVLAGRVRGGR